MICWQSLVSGWTLPDWIGIYMIGISGFAATELEVEYRLDLQQLALAVTVVPDSLFFSGVLVVDKTDLLLHAKAALLTPSGLDERGLEQVLGRMISRQVDYAELYFQYQYLESWSLEEGQVKTGSYNVDQGVGLRAISDEKTGFAYTDAFELSALLQAADAARAISQQPTAKGQSIHWKDKAPALLYAPTNPIDSLTAAQKVTLLEQVEAEARAQDPRVVEVMVSLAAVQEIILVAGSDGRLAADIRPLIRLHVSVIVEQDGRREQAGSGGGSRCDMSYFQHQERALGYGREAVRQALVNLEAVSAPAGNMTVVLGPGWPGILLHEAVGHGLEGDFNRKGTSAFSGRMGERVGAAGVTVVDDATLPSRRGSLNIDDEGIPGQRTVLIENGMLVGYMQDRMNAGLMGVASTGNGRRESYAHLPMPRMTNTFMLPGAFDHDEIIQSVDHGLYAANFGGGQVDITSGKFVFSASEAYLLEHGRITAPVKGATLIGNGPDVLQRVSMIGNNLELDTGVGTCGKEGQSVPVGVGQPTLKIDGLTVGGVQV